MPEQKPRTKRVLKSFLWEVKARDGQIITVTANHRLNAVYDARRLWEKKNPGVCPSEFGVGSAVTCLTPERPRPLSEDKLWPEGKSKYSRSGRARIAYIYVVKCGPFVKVGASQDVANRVSTLRGACPYPVRFVASQAVKSAMAGQIERETMEALREHHHYREWFKCSAKQAEYALMRVVRRHPDARPDPLRDDV